jgi:hypothetical protein
MKRRRAWTAEHIRTLKTLARKRRRAAEIARRLKRTEGATRQKAFSLRLSLETRAGKISQSDPISSTKKLALFARSEG